MSEHIILSKLGSRIRELRIGKSMSQYDLANVCAFEKASMSRIESGQTNLTVRSLYKISLALDVPLAEMFRLRENEINNSRMK